MGSSISLQASSRYHCEECGHQSDRNGDCPKCGHWEMLDHLNTRDRQYLAARHEIRSANRQDWLTTLGMEIVATLVTLAIIPLILLLYYVLGGLALSVMLAIPASVVIVGACFAVVHDQRQSRRLQAHLEDPTEG